MPLKSTPKDRMSFLNSIDKKKAGTFIGAGDCVEHLRKPKQQESRFVL